LIKDQLKKKKEEKKEEKKEQKKEQKTENKIEFKQTKKDEKATIDVGFVMDATGSMSSWIVATKENILSIVEQMKESYPNQKN